MGEFPEIDVCIEGRLRGCRLSLKHDKRLTNESLFCAWVWVILATNNNQFTEMEKHL